MKKVPVILLGAGGVGRALLQQIIDGRANIADRNNLEFQLVAVADSRRWLYDANGIDDETIAAIIDRKKRRKQLGDERPDVAGMVDQAIADGHANGILVDVTAQEGIEPALNHALNNGWSIALANKKPFAGAWETAQPFFGNAAVRHESTVGGGQPVIATLRYLLDSNDAPTRIRGQLSGTLGYLCQRMDEGVEFSKAVAEAKAKGFTEPDPREDLGGMDVMRKVLILARMSGWQLEADDIEVESLYSKSLAHLSVPEFMAAVRSMDPSLRDRVQAAHEEGMVLRYVADVSADGGKVGLQAIPNTSSLANLKFISFTTGHYDDEPLMLVGKGAGVGMTAAGVIGDMIGLARERF